MTGEVAALVLVVLSLSMSVVTWFDAHFLEGRYDVWVLGATSIGVSLLAGLAFIVQAVFYVRNRAWAHRVFILENILLVMFGVLWFLRSQNDIASSRDIAAAGFILSVATLIPLLWALRSFSRSPFAGQ